MSELRFPGYLLYITLDRRYLLGTDSRFEVPMKITERCDIISNGQFPNSPEWKSACDEVEEAILATDWPHGSGTFTIYPESGKKRGEGNGVKPIKTPCVQRLESLGWLIESLPKIEHGELKTGDLDALKQTTSGHIGFEWETGNISSSHLF